MIRPAEHSDVAEICFIYAAATQKHHYEPIKYTVADFRAYVNDSRSYLLVSVELGVVRGFLLAYDLLSWCYLDILCVMPEYRRKGDATKLLEDLALKSDCIEACYYAPDDAVESFLQHHQFQFNPVRTTWVKRG